MSADLSARLRFASERIGTQKEAAAAFGVSETQVNRYVQGRSRPSPEAFELIAFKSRLSLAWLLTGEGPADSSHAEGKAIADESMVRILEKRVTELEAELAEARSPAGGQAIPMLIWCPDCSARHIDEGEFATKAHHTHACQQCGNTWRPAVVATVGIRFLPGFSNGR